MINTTLPDFNFTQGLGVADVATMLHRTCARRLLAFFLPLILLIGGSSESALSIEWETAFEVACCANRRGYERDAARLSAALIAHHIDNKIIYFIRINAVDAVTEDTAHATRFGVFVDTKGAARARKVVAQEVAKGVSVTSSCK